MNMDHTTPLSPVGLPAVNGMSGNDYRRLDSAAARRNGTERSVRMRFRRIPVVVAAATAIVACTLVRVTALAESYNQPSAIFPAGDVEHGKELATPCLVCHGENGPLFGDPKFHSPKLLHQHVESIFYALEDYKSGRRKSVIMAPIAAGLTEPDMRDIAVYLTGPPEKRTHGRPGPSATRAAPPSQQPQNLSSEPPDYVFGMTEVTAVCGFCHGRTGEGVMPGVPVVGGQYQDYLKYALSSYASGERSNLTMRKVVRQLTPQQVQAATFYLSSQSRLGSAP